MPYAASQKTGQSPSSGPSLRVSISIWVPRVAPQVMSDVVEWTIRGVDGFLRPQNSALLQLLHSLPNAGKPDRQADMRLKTTPVTSRSYYLLQQCLGCLVKRIPSLLPSPSPSTNLPDKHDYLPGPALFALLFGHHDTHSLHETELSYTSCCRNNARVTVTVTLKKKSGHRRASLPSQQSKGGRADLAGLTENEYPKPLIVIHPDKPFCSPASNA